MMYYREMKGDLIKMAKEGYFDVITHGCNCMSKMNAGIAVPMKEAFEVNLYPMEMQGPDMGKLGNIDWDYWSLEDNTDLIVVNSYTQYKYGRNHKDGIKDPLDYEALTLCMRKINDKFFGRHIGLPQIGCGLAGGDWSRVSRILQKELKNCNVTIVIYDKS